MAKKREPTYRLELLGCKLHTHKPTGVIVGERWSEATYGVKEVKRVQAILNILVDLGLLKKLKGRTKGS